MRALITNFGNKSIDLPRRLKVGRSYEGREECTPTINVLEPSQPLQLSPTELAERRAYVIEHLNISENTLLYGEDKIQEKLIQLFLDNWNAIATLGSNYGKRYAKTTNAGLEVDTRPVCPQAQTVEPPHDAASTEQPEIRGKEDNTNRDMSLWASALVPCKKEGSGAFKWAIDYRKVQELTVQDRFPLKPPNHRLHQVGGSIIFSCLKDYGTSQSNVFDEHYRDIFNCVPRFGSYFSLYLPMGPSKYPTNYSQLVHMDLDQLPCGFALAYVDDVLIHGPTLEGHLTQVGQLLKLHSAFGIKLRLNECHIFQREVEY